MLQTVFIKYKYIIGITDDDPCVLSRVILSINKVVFFLNSHADQIQRLLLDYLVCEIGLVKFQIVVTKHEDLRRRIEVNDKFVYFGP